jgi:segregation and condensation protein B
LQWFNQTEKCFGALFLQAEFRTALQLFVIAHISARKIMQLCGNMLRMLQGESAGMSMVETGKATILAFTPPGTRSTGEERGLPEAASAENQPNASSHAADMAEHLRMAEAILFASAEPVSETALAARLPDGANLSQLLPLLQQNYRSRGINLVRIGRSWAFRTADDLGFMLSREAVELKKLSRAALEVLAIVAYHQPVTRSEIEEIRGVATSRGTLDVLLETGWIRMRGRRRTPGRPVTYGTTDVFLDHFGLAELRDLPGLEELKGAGLLQSQLPANFRVPVPDDTTELTEDEDPLEPHDIEALGLLTPGGANDD